MITTIEKVRELRSTHHLTQLDAAIVLAKGAPATRRASDVTAWKLENDALIQRVTGETVRGYPGDYVVLDPSSGVIEFFTADQFAKDFA